LKEAELLDEKRLELEQEIQINKDILSQVSKMTGSQSESLKQQVLKPWHKALVEKEQ
jgi:hypothetical protein